jgi:hypothetical protein
MPHADGFTGEMKITFGSWVVEARIEISKFSRPEESKGTLINRL